MSDALPTAGEMAQEWCFCIDGKRMIDDPHVQGCEVPGIAEAIRARDAAIRERVEGMKRAVPDPQTGMVSEPAAHNLALDRVLALLEPTHE